MPPPTYTKTDFVMSKISQVVSTSGQPRSIQPYRDIKLAFNLLLLGRCVRCPCGFLVNSRLRLRLLTLIATYIQVGNGVPSYKGSQA